MTRLSPRDASILAVVAEHRGLELSEFSLLLKHAEQKTRVRTIAGLILAMRTPSDCDRFVGRYSKDVVDTAAAILEWSERNQPDGELVLATT